MTGSDRAESSYMERLRAAGLEPSRATTPPTSRPDAEVVVSTAVPEDNPSWRGARARPAGAAPRRAARRALRRARLLAVAGTHGKTTTAAMCVHALREAGADPSFFSAASCRAPARGAPANAGWGAGEWVVAEADESDGSFLKLRPRSR